MGIGHDLLYAPCPCGSGRKFKFCCYPAVRDELPPNPVQAEMTTAVRRANQPFGMVNDIDPVEDREAIAPMRRGFVLRDAFQFEEALPLFRQAREMRPKLYTAWNNEALCLWHSGHYAEAVAAQEAGLALSADVNAFGWAQLAEFRYFLGDDQGAADAADKAAAMPPMSSDAATKTCSALAHLRRHADLLAYARGCGFDQTPMVGFYAGGAALNLGDNETAMPFLLTAQGLFEEDVDADDSGESDDPGGDGDGPADEEPFTSPSAPFGEELYFSRGTYGAGPFVHEAIDGLKPEYRNVLCDLVEMGLVDGTIDKGDALALLEPYRGGRADFIREVLASTHEFDGLPEDDGEGGGEEEGNGAFPPDEPEERR